MMRITIFFASILLLLNPSFSQETRYQTYKAQFKISTVKEGEIYKNELNIPAFNGFDNEVDLWIVFSAFSN